MDKLLHLLVDTNNNRHYVECSLKHKATYRRLYETQTGEKVCSFGVVEKKPTDELITEVVSISHINKNAVRKQNLSKDPIQRFIDKYSNVEDVVVNFSLMTVDFLQNNNHKSVLVAIRTI